MASALLQLVARGAERGAAARGCTLLAAARRISGARGSASEADASARATTPAAEHKTPSKYVRARDAPPARVARR